MFLDEEMSEGVLMRLKEDEETKDIPVIITASDASIMAVSRYYKLGAADFIKKPFVENVLFRRIDVVCALKDDGHTDGSDLIQDGRYSAENPQKMVRSGYSAGGDKL